jgi:hypothetical protein
LLSAVEQARLMDYEIGLKIYERAKDKHAPGGAAAEAAAEGDELRFRFEGEYWNDELRDYRFEMQDRCGDPR